MVMLYVGGQYVGKLQENPDLLAQLVRGGDRIDLRDETGKPLGQVIPTDEPLVPWDSTIARADLDRRAAEPGLSFDEVQQRLGWK